MSYVNPLSKIQGLVPERIDQGVDYGGTGPILSIGNGLVLGTTNSGWPGGAFIAIRLTDGQYAGNVTYFAEDITPTVSPGQTVTAGQQVGTVFNGGSGIEVGWCDPDIIGESMARANGQIAPTGDPGEVSSAYGASFSSFLVSLGAPGGILQGAIVGTVSGNYPQPGGPAPVTRTMYDALEASGIPHGAQIACWYPHDPRSDGPPVGAQLVLTIDNSGAHADCNILDVESGAASPADIPSWLDNNHTAFPTIYCNESTLPSVVSAAGTRKFYLWIAVWDGSPSPVYFSQYPTVTTVAKQYASNNAYDTSSVYNNAWYGSTPPVLTPYATPANVTATPGATGVDVSWGAVAGAEAYMYEVQHSSGVLVVGPLDTAATSVSIALAPGTYSVRVQTHDSPTHTWSAWSPWVTFIVALTPYPTPVSLVAAEETAKNVTLSWNGVAVSYQYEVDNAAGVVIPATDVNGTKVTVQLAPGDYNFRVVAHISATHGWSSWTAWTAFTVV